MDDYGMKRYVLHICCLDNHISCTTSGSENGGLRKPNALCTQRVALTKEFPDSLGKKRPEFSNVLHQGFTCVDTMKGHKGKIHRQPLPTATNFLTGLLIGLGGFQSGTQSGTVGGEV